MIYVFRGIRALSDFRAEALAVRLKKVDPAVKTIDAEFVHVVDASSQLNSDEEEQLKGLLAYGQPFKPPKDPAFLVVSPRFGTTSPWSSKATDIAHNTGLAKIRRVERVIAYYIRARGKVSRHPLLPLLHDRMTESVLLSINEADKLFEQHQPRPTENIAISKQGKKALTAANERMALALNEAEIDYLYQTFQALGRDPTDVELMMFGQVNSEHTRHKIFNSQWKVEGQQQLKSLFQMIKNTYEHSSAGILSAYSDNAAVLEGHQTARFYAGEDQVYARHPEAADIVIKAETHNHPTAIAPNPGAATGAGGEIRDEGSTGTGAKPKAGFAGYSVSNLELPDALKPWEKPYGRPDHVASALDIMLAAPIGAASYSNEYGRPTITGFFRTYQQESGGQVWGYHKPLMIAGGLGNIRRLNVAKKPIPPGALVIVLGGPAMLIGLGGGAASSLASGASRQDLDFASVQRANAEMQRRAQEVIDGCWAKGEDNPILSIHDIGAGGLSNGVPELIWNAGLGGRFELRDIPNAEPGMSPLEIWCNEAQERYVLAIEESALQGFNALCERERTPFAIIGRTTKEQQLVLTDSHFDNRPIDLPLTSLFGQPPRLQREYNRQEYSYQQFKTSGIKLDDAIERVLQIPAVGSKKFLITIGDRSVGGMIHRDPMVGPWQVPVADAAVTSSAIGSISGEAMAIGERPAVALANPAASVRMAIGEAMTNIASVPIARLQDVKLSANWMAAVGQPGQDQALFEGVKAAGEDFCPALGLTIPVGKDSLSMRTFWQADKTQKSVVSPLSLVASAFAPVADIARCLTPQLSTDEGSVLLLIDLGQGRNRLGGSSLAQAYNQIGGQPPDIEPEALKNFFQAIQKLNSQGKILAYHDRSDGGLLATVAEMMFAAHLGLDIDLSNLTGDTISKLFSEELGAVIQISKDDHKGVVKTLQGSGLTVYSIGEPNDTSELRLFDHGKLVYGNKRATLERIWSDTSYRIQRLRDNPQSADEEFQHIDKDDPGLSPTLDYRLPVVTDKTKPKVAIIREEGVNGHVEMAAAFTMAGFTAVDVHMTQLLGGQSSLKDFSGLAAAGGFSYGDVLGAGEGWAKTILYNKGLRRMLSDFFGRPSTFTLGACNGCQMLAALKELIPGADCWPRFVQNRSEQFEGRLVTIKVQQSPSILFGGMADQRLLVPVAHGEGRAQFIPNQLAAAKKSGLISAQYVDNFGRPTESYPFNPSGSPEGITALTTPDGRATILMPHPERGFLTSQLSWHPNNWPEESPLFGLFLNARQWLKKHK